MQMRIDTQTLLKWLLGAVLFFGVLVIGAYVGLLREDIPYAALERAYAGPASKFVDLPSGVRAHYRIEGKQDGRTLVLVHAYGLSLESWTAWVRELRDNYRVVSIDLPGHGLTRSPEDYAPSFSGLADFIDEFAGVVGLTKFVAIGTSMGGSIVCRLATRHPERTEALVLIDAVGWPGKRESDPMALKLLSNPRIQPLVIKLSPGGGIQNNLNASYENKALVTDAMITRYSEMARAPGHRRIVGALLLGRYDEYNATPGVLAAIKVPTLILWGSKDALTPANEAQKFGDAIAGSKVIVYDGVGHSPHEEIPAKSAVDLKAFLEALRRE